MPTFSSLRMLGSRVSRLVLAFLGMSEDRGQRLKVDETHKAGTHCLSPTSHGLEPDSNSMVLLVAEGDQGVVANQ